MKTSTQDQAESKIHKVKGEIKNIITVLIALLVLGLAAGTASSATAVDLGGATDFTILAKSGISTTGTTSIVGDIGVSPIDSSAITGFGLIMDSSNQFATSSLVIGKVYAADYAPPTPTKMTTAISDMQTAYTDAAGRTLPDYTELGAGDIGGLTLTPGLYKWSTGVIIPTDVTLSGGANDVWIFQIAQTLDISSGKHVILSGGAQAKNIFWQVADQTTLGTTSVFNGNILDQTTIVLNTGATLNGRAFSQTAVTLDANAVTAPASVEVVGNTTIGVYSAGMFFLSNSNEAGAADIAFQFGQSGLTPLAGDYDSNGNDTAGAYNVGTGTFFLKNSNSPGAADIIVQYGPGGSGYVPVVGDWDGSGSATVGIYQTSTGTFFLKNSNSPGAADIIVQYGPGGNGYVPIVGDWDGSGSATVGIYQTSTGTFFLKNSNSPGAADTTVQYGPGGSGFVPVVGDWDGSGNATIGIYHTSTGTFFLKNSNSPGAADATVQYGPGGSDFAPLVGDWNGR